MIESRGLVSYNTKSWRIQGYYPELIIGTCWGQKQICIMFHTVVRITGKGFGFRILGFGFGFEKFNKED